MNISRQCWDLTQSVIQKEVFILPGSPSDSNPTEMFQVLSSHQTFILTPKDNPFDVLGFICGEAEQIGSDMHMLKLIWVCAKNFTPSILKFLLVWVNFLKDNIESIL